MKEYMILAILASPVAQNAVTENPATPIDPNTHIQKSQDGKIIPEKIECDKELSRKDNGHKADCTLGQGDDNKDKPEAGKLLNDRVK